VGTPEAILLAKNLLLSTKINNTAESSVDYPTNITDKGSRTISGNNENSASYSASSIQISPSSPNSEVLK